MTISERLRKAALGPLPKKQCMGARALRDWLLVDEDFFAASLWLDVGEYDWAAFYWATPNTCRMFLLFCAAAEEGNQ